jgi:hypothetical protein
MIRKTYSFISILLLSATTTYGQKDAKENYVPVEPIVVDGQTAEWKTDWLLDPDGKFLFNIGNDEQNLYLRIKVSDDLTQQKIALYGLYVKMDVNGKKKGKLGLKYPVGKDANELKAAPEPFPKDAAGKAMAKRQLLSEIEVLELLGLAKENIVSSRLGLMNGIEVLIFVDENAAYVYEAKIPFKAFRIDKATTPVLGVTIETGKMAPPKTSTPSNGQGQRYNQGAGNYELMTPAYMWVGAKLK